MTINQLKEEIRMMIISQRIKNENKKIVMDQQIKAFYEQKMNNYKKL